MRSSRPAGGLGVRGKVGQQVRIGVAPAPVGRVGSERVVRDPAMPPAGIDPERPGGLLVKQEIRGGGVVEAVAAPLARNSWRSLSSAVVHDSPADGGDAAVGLDLRHGQARLGDSEHPEHRQVQPFPRAFVAGGPADAVTGPQEVVPGQRVQPIRPSVFAFGEPRQVGAGVVGRFPDHGPQQRQVAEVPARPFRRVRGERGGTHASPAEHLLDKLVPRDLPGEVRRVRAEGGRPG